MGVIASETVGLAQQLRNDRRVEQPDLRNTLFPLVEWPRPFDVHDDPRSGVVHLLRAADVPNRLSGRIGGGDLLRTDVGYGDFRKGYTPTLCRAPCLLNGRAE